jgi:CheY-like chemotaxis protein
MWPDFSASMAGPGSPCRSARCSAAAAAMRVRIDAAVLVAHHQDLAPGRIERFGLAFLHLVQRTVDEQCVNGFTDAPVRGIRCRRRSVRMRLSVEERSAAFAKMTMSQGRILIVDDNPLSANLAKIVLENDGLEVAVAASSEETLREIGQFDPDLVLMDVNLPDINGLVVAERLKLDPATKHIVVIAFTAYPVGNIREKMIAAGCQGYIAKPIDISTFARSVRACMVHGRNTEPAPLA